MYLFSSYILDRPRFGEMVLQRILITNSVNEKLHQNKQTKKKRDSLDELSRSIYF